MPSITNKTYRLPHIYATGYLKTFNTGANAPILTTGIDMDTHKKGEFVIKLKEGESMKDPSANLRELLAALMAMEMDIPVIQPVVAEVTLQFAETITDPSSKMQAKKSIGLNFGSVYIGSYTTLPVAPLPEKLLPFAQMLFAFDLFIQNADRNKIKPNMLTNGEEIVALDHEKAFGFTFAPFLPANLWEINEAGREWIRNHILYPLIKKGPFDFEGFSRKCTNLNGGFWDAAENLIPGEWKTEQFTTIKDKIQAFISQRDKFISELKIIMS